MLIERNGGHLYSEEGKQQGLICFLNGVGLTEVLIFKGANAWKIQYPFLS
ncbi:hypothetical protein [Segetibacter koreensis]|nr:hypothetical protein [Segetibacter koreensis]